jgi:hypothetical protein
VPVRPKPVATSSQIKSVPKRPQVAGRLDADPRRALHQRLDDHGGDLLAMALEDALEIAGIAGARLPRAEEEGLVGRVEEVDPADGDRAEGVAVVGVAEGDEAGAPRVLPAALMPVLERHLERDLRCRRPGVRVEDPAQPRRREVDQACGELRSGLVGEAEHGGVRDPVELCPDRRVDPRVAMPVHVAPQRRDAVDIAAAVGVEEVGALSLADHDRVLADPVPHLRERVPEVVVIQLPRARPHGSGRT